VQLLNSPVELTSAVTDLAIAAISITIVTRLRGSSRAHRWKAALWSWVFGLLALGAFAGALAHGFNWPEDALHRFQHPIFLSLGVAVALLVVGAIYDWRGAEEARRVLPWAVLVGLGFYVSTRLLGGDFLAFVLYEAAAVTAALAIYVSVWFRGQSPGTAFMVMGVSLTLLAAFLQTTDLAFRLVVPFDSNGIFHLVQIVAIVFLSLGLTASLESADARVPGPASGSSTHPRE
jgi:uncharacterized membrane protein YidH (DUF202 family)